MNSWAKTRTDSQLDAASHKAIIADAQNTALFGLAGLADRRDAINIVNVALCGLSTRQAEDIVPLLRAKHLVRNFDQCEHGCLDAVTAALLTESGIDPLAAAWFAMSVDVRTIKRRFLDTIEIDVDEHTGSGLNTTRIALTDEADPVVWYGNGSLLIHDVPDTVIVASAGRRLRDLVDHPALNAFDIVIREARVGEPGFASQLMLDVDMRALTAAELERARHAHYPPRASRAA